MQHVYTKIYEALHDECKSESKTNSLTQLLHKKKKKEKKYAQMSTESYRKIIQKCNAAVAKRYHNLDILR